MELFQEINKQKAILRLTALWAFNESALGGLLHLFKTPFTGVFVGGAAVILISLIAYFSDQAKKDIARSLVLVLIIKAIISPHSPPTAYLAVSFQGLLGAFLYTLIGNHKIASFLFAVIALLESAFQKLLTLTLLFGKSFFEAMDAMYAYILNSFLSLTPNVSGSYWLVGFYLMIYLMAGFIIGWFAGQLPAALHKQYQKQNALDLNAIEAPEQASVKKKSGFRRNLGLAIIMASVFLTTFYIKPVSKGNLYAIWLLLRVVLILGIYYLIVAPMLLRALKAYLKKKESGLKTEVDQTLALLPSLKKIVIYCWNDTSNLRGINRFKAFIIKTISFSLTY